MTDAYEIISALRGLPDVGDMPPDDIVAELARDLRKHFTPSERLCLALGAMHSLSPDARDKLIRTAERGRKADSVFRRVGCHPVAHHG